MLQEPERNPRMSNFIDKFPPEIIIKIFNLCLPNLQFPKPSPPEAPLLLTHVCASWRTFVQRSLIFWRSLGLKYAKGGAYAVKSRRGRPTGGCCGRYEPHTVSKNLLALWNAQSKHSLQELSISCDRYHRSVSSQLSVGLSKDFLLANASSLRILKLEEEGDGTAFLDILPESLPVLEVLYWGRSPQGMFDPLYLQTPNAKPLCLAPNLHSLHLSNMKLDIQRCPTNLPWKDIRRLSLSSRPGQSQKTFYTVLKECTLLEYLAIMVDDDYNDLSLGRPIIAKCLEQLKIYFGPSSTANPSFFHSIDFPILTSFRLCSNTGEPSPSFSFNAYALSPVFPFDGLPHLRLLTLRYHDLTADRLAKILRLTPLLVDLRVDSLSLGNYTTFLEALTLSENQRLIPLLEHFELYIELVDIDVVDFSEEAFFTMIHSRIDSTPRHLHTLMLYVEDTPEGIRVNVPVLREKQQSLDMDLGELSLSIQTSDDLSVWLKEPKEDILF